MKTTARPVARPRFPIGSGPTARLPDFIALAKPRVTALAIFTAAAGLFMSSDHLDPLLGAVALMSIATGAGVRNVWYHADIDELMTRTSWRPIPDGKVSRSEALCFGLVLARGAERRGGRASCVLNRLLRRCVDDMAEVADASEHCHRWRRRRSSAGHWLGLGDRWHRARAAATYGVRIDRGPVLAERLTSAVRAIRGPTQFTGEGS